MINVIINNKDYSVPKGATILETCQQSGIEIPTLCHDERLKPGESCNLCVVEIEGEEELKNSCSLIVGENMKIWTDNDRVINARKEVLYSLSHQHPYAFSNCYKTEGCKIHSYRDKYEISNEISQLDIERYPIDNNSPFYYIDPNKCIKCDLCIRVCDELQGTNCLEYNDKGYISKRYLSDDKDTSSVECEECGNCISVCPTGAIVPKEFLEEFADEEEMEPTHEEPVNVKTTCSYCGVGCQMELVVKNKKVVDVKPVNVLPNKGMLCVKGRFGYKFIDHPDRLKTPLIKKNGTFVEATWEEAYSLIVKKAKELKIEYGGEVFGGLSSARCTNEENYLFQKLIRAGFGSNNVDHCARL